MMITLDNVDLVFEQRPPKTALDASDMDEVRCCASEFVKVILRHVPNCGDRAAAILHVRQAVFLANAAIALEGLI